MKLIKKIAAGLLLSLGFLGLLITVAELLDQDVTQKEKVEAPDTLLGGLAFSLPPLAIGSWLVWGLYRQEKQQARDRLHSTFFRLIEEGKGQITVLRFAKETQLSGEEAKRFLDEKAQEFDATFDNDNQGRISYQFHL